MFEITDIDAEPVALLRYLNARSGGGSDVSRLEILRAPLAASLGDELEAIVCCSDLQGVVKGELLGVAVAHLLTELAESGALPRLARTGVVLAGDLYSVPAANKRGGFGDVSTVWAAFAERFPWVVGVAGNHDDMTSVVDMADHVHVLDGTNVDIDGIRFGGVGRIIGNPARPGRRDENEQLGKLHDVLTNRCDVLLLHEGPNGDDDQPGNPDIRELIDLARVPLTVCGHTHWDSALARTAHGQIVNVDARVLVLVASQ